MNKTLKSCGLMAAFGLTALVPSMIHAGTYQTCAAQHGEYQQANDLFQWAQNNLPPGSITPYRTNMVQKRRVFEQCMML